MPIRAVPRGWFCVLNIIEQDSFVLNIAYPILGSLVRFTQPLKRAQSPPLARQLARVVSVDESKFKTYTFSDWFEEKIRRLKLEFLRTVLGRGSVFIIFRSLKSSDPQTLVFAPSTSCAYGNNVGDGHRGWRAVQCTRIHWANTAAGAPLSFQQYNNNILSLRSKLPYIHVQYVHDDDACLHPSSVAFYCFAPTVFMCTYSSTYKYENTDTIEFVFVCAFSRRQKAKYLFNTC